VSNHSRSKPYNELLGSVPESGQSSVSLQEEIESVSELLVKIMDSSVDIGGDLDVPLEKRNLRFHQANELEKLLKIHPEWRMVFAKISFIRGGIVMYEDEHSI